MSWAGQIPRFLKQSATQEINIPPVPVKVQEIPEKLQSQNVTFVDETKDWEVSVDTALDPTFKISDNSDTLLANFLSRPIRLSHTHLWTPSTFTTVDVFPWSEFFGSDKVKDKMQNFNLLRATLKLKFIVNGNAFQYGTLVAVYTPLPGEGTLAEPIDNDKESATIIYTQRPHIFLSPTNSQGGVMSLPFIWPYNYLSLPATEYAAMGIIRIYQLNALKNAGTTSSNADVNIFAWAEDVELAIPTSQTIGSITSSVAVSQSGDEYGRGPISAPANAIADAAMSIADAPVIGPYARASSYVARAVGAIANLMGFSRPAIISDIVPYKPMYYGNIANTNTGDTVEKLTIDCKQEVTIDPRVAGMAAIDEMSIVSIAAREAYYFQTTWSNQTSQDLRVCVMNVTPMAYRLGSPYTTNAPEPIYLSPCAYVANPFKYWRGTMKYRFQIVASAFHRGRLRVVWDPNQINDNDGTSTERSFKDYNVAYSSVIDIATCRDFTVEVGWGQIKTYQKTAYIPGYNLPTFFTGTTAATSYSRGACNGQLGLYIVNKLVSLSTDVNQIYVNVYVSCPDLELFSPDEHRINNYTLRPMDALYPATPTTLIAESQSGMELLVTSDLNAPLAQDSSHNIVLGPIKPQGVDHSAEVYHGDPIVSIRTLLKRYCSYATYVVKTSLPAALITINQYLLSDFPTFQGLNLKGNSEVYIKDTTGNSQRWSLCKNTFLNYFTPCYVTRRGGIRWKYALLSPKNLTLTTLSVVREATTPALPPERAGCQQILRQTIIQSKTSSSSYTSTTRMPEGTSGMAVTCTSQNPVVQAEIPYYSEKRFKFARHVEFEKPPDDDLHLVTFNITNETPFSNTLDSYVAAADDYSLSFFLSTPILWRIPKSDILPTDTLELFDPIVTT